MSIPRSTHYVPKFFLSGFCDPHRKTPTLWVYERNKPVRKSTPSREAKQRDFYALGREASVQCAIERWLSKVEAKAASILTAVQGKNRGFSESEKADLAFFIAQMFSRVPAAREFLSNCTEGLLKVLEDPEKRVDPAFLALHDAIRQATSVSLKPDELLTLLRREKEIEQPVTRRRELGMLLRWTPLFAEVFLKFSWQVWEADNNQLFITSDTPVITLRPQDDGLAELGVGFLASGTRVYFPLSARKCLVMLHDGREGHRKIAPSLTRMINRAILSCAKRFVYSPTRADALAKLFSRVGCRLDYGVNCFNKVEITTG